MSVFAGVAAFGTSVFFSTSAPKPVNLLLITSVDLEEFTEFIALVNSWCDFLATVSFAFASRLL